PARIEAAQALFVLDQQDRALPGVVSGLRGLVGTPWSACLRGRRHVLDGRDVARQEDAEGRAFADGRFRIDEAAGLLDDAIDGGEAKPGALADFFRREERLEDTVDDLGRNAGSGIGDLD